MSSAGIAVLMAGGDLFVGTMTEGTGAGPSLGYSSIAPFGSMSTVATSDGKTIESWYVSNVPTTFLSITGFSSDPGQSYFTTAYKDAVAVTSASATYGYAGGRAQWTWNASNAFGFVGSGSRTMRLVK